MITGKYYNDGDYHVTKEPTSIFEDGYIMINHLYIETEGDLLYV